MQADVPVARNAQGGIRSAMLEHAREKHVILARRALLRNLRSSGIAGGAKGLLWLPLALR